MSNLIPISFDSFLGYSRTANVEAQMGGVSTDPALNSRINVVGKRLGAQTENRSLPYQFKALNTQQVNAFALPGGPTYVTVGLLNGLNPTDDELAAVMGHELGHVNARHGVKGMELSLGSGFVTDLVKSQLKKSDKLNLDSNDINRIDKYNKTMAGFISLGYGRENEYEADAKGLDYMVQAGYNPYAMVSLMSKLQAMEGRKETNLEEFYSTHPSTTKRIGEINDIIKTNYPAAKPMVASSPRAQAPSQSPLMQVSPTLWPAVGLGAVILGYGVYWLLRKPQAQSNPPGTKAPKDIKPEFWEAAHKLHNSLYHLAKDSDRRVIESYQSTLMDFFSGDFSLDTMSKVRFLLDKYMPNWQATQRNPAGLATTGYYVIIGGKKHPVSSAAEASTKYTHAIDTLLLGASELPPELAQMNIYDANDKVIAFISYNGKVWPVGGWKRGVEPLYSPYAKNPILEFKSTEDAIAYGQSIVGQADKINQLRQMRWNVLADIRDIKACKQPDFNLWSKLAAQASFINEALKAAGLKANPSDLVVTGMKMASLDQIKRKFQATGSAVIAEKPGARLIIKDEGDYVVVGMDTGSLTSTDVKLPTKTFAGAAEAFEFISSLSDPLAREKQKFQARFEKTIAETAHTREAGATGAFGSVSRGLAHRFEHAVSKVSVAAERSMRSDIFYALSRLTGPSDSAHWDKVDAILRKMNTAADMSDPVKYGDVSRQPYVWAKKEAIAHFIDRYGSMLTKRHLLAFWAA